MNTPRARSDSGVGGLTLRLVGTYCGQNRSLVALFGSVGFPVRVALQLVYCWQVVRKGICGLPQLFAVMCEPAVAPELARRSVAAGLGPEVCSQMLELLLVQRVDRRSSWRRTGALAATTATLTAVNRHNGWKVRGVWCHGFACSAAQRRHRDFVVLE